MYSLTFDFTIHDQRVFFSINEIFYTDRETPISLLIAYVFIKLRYPNVFTKCSQINSRFIVHVSAHSCHAVQKHFLLIICDVS